MNYKIDDPLFDKQLNAFKSSKDLSKQITENSIKLDNIKPNEKIKAKDAEKIEKAVRDWSNKNIIPPILTEEQPKEEIEKLYDTYQSIIMGREFTHTTSSCRLPIENILLCSRLLMLSCVETTLKDGTVKLNLKNPDIEKQTLASQGTVKYISESTELMYKTILNLTEDQGGIVDNVFKIQVYVTCFVRACFNFLLLIDNREFYSKSIAINKFNNLLKVLFDLIKAARFPKNFNLKKYLDTVMLGEYFDDVMQGKQVVWPDNVNKQVLDSYCSFYFRLYFWER